jgi:hypothetical protein
MIRRLVLAAGVAATAATMACGSDQSTNIPTTGLSSAALALHFDTLAGALQASSPHDVRLKWYQSIASILALGVSPSGSNVHLAGGPAVLETLTEVDAFADSANGKKIADSTYRLAGWSPSTRPTEFVDVRVRFLPAGIGNPDTTATYITFYFDTTGDMVVDSTEKVILQALSNRGLCQITALQHLTVPSNPCTKVAVDWEAGAGTNLLFINPAVQVSGTHLTQ